MTGGGWPEKDLPRGLAAEGFAMLRAVLDDFLAWGGATVVTTRDVRLAGCPLIADEVVNLPHDKYLATFRDLLAGVDAALVIAPESEGVLTRLSALVEESGTLLLGSTAAAVSIAGDKWECFQRFSRNGLATPHTRLVKSAEILVAAGGFEFPLVGEARRRCRMRRRQPCS